MAEPDNIDELLRLVEQMAKSAPPGVGGGRITGIKSLSIPTGTGHNIVVLDRIEPGVTPPYCTHGRATCITCDEWVWLGHQTQHVVSDEAALPMCQQCAVRNIPRGMKPIGRIKDHRREDGPHE